ncbi:MAG: hypothetical protein KGI60_03215 [Patescibacteria group bacterium]|nr:hypothetical protein [Patescibacteria group bacterium]
MGQRLLLLAWNIAWICAGTPIADSLMTAHPLLFVYFLFLVWPTILAAGYIAIRFLINESKKWPAPP